MLEINIFPSLGSKPIADILPKDILACLRPIEGRGTIEAAHRTLQTIETAWCYRAGQGRYVFPSIKTPNGSRPMSDMALSTALRCMGFDKTQMTVHGFRAMARTILDEVLGFRPDFIEHQLAHAVRDANGRTCNRTSHLPERHKMMQAWSDYLASLKNGAQVIAFKNIG